MANKQSRQHYEKAGRRAETLAAFWLRLKGYRILETRFKTYSGEIDIIARKRKILVIVEVKQRRSAQAAHDSLTYTAQKRIADAVDIYLAKTPTVQSLAIRYDAVFVYGLFQLEHLKDAWRDY